MRKYITAPNLITCIRILGTVTLLFIEPFCTAFYVIWLICGISDALDGATARLLKKESTFGSRLDSIADIMYYLLMLFRILPTLVEILPRWIWILVAAIAATRIAAYVTAFVKYRRFASIHSYLNKASGFMLFFVPFLTFMSWFWIYCTVLCGIGLASSVEELIIHIISKNYDDSNKTLIGIARKKSTGSSQ